MCCCSTKFVFRVHGCDAIVQLKQSRVLTCPEGDLSIRYTSCNRSNTGRRGSFQNPVRGRFFVFGFCWRSLAHHAACVVGTLFASPCAYPCAAPLASVLVQSDSPRMEGHCYGRYRAPRDFPKLQSQGGWPKATTSAGIQPSQSLREAPRTGKTDATS